MIPSTEPPLCDGIHVGTVGGVEYNRCMSWEEHNALWGEPRGKLWRTTGYLPGCSMAAPWRGVYGYRPLPSDSMFHYATVMFYDEGGRLTRFDPDVHVTVDGSYPDGVSDESPKP